MPAVAPVVWTLAVDVSVRVLLKVLISHRWALIFHHLEIDIAPVDDKALLYLEIAPIDNELVPFSDLDIASLDCEFAPCWTLKSHR